MTMATLWGLPRLKRFPAQEAEARARGYRVLLLETHPSKEYEAARALYERRGYTYREPFGDYVSSPHSVFMELVLSR
jgi:putative acetyltransferase